MEKNGIHYFGKKMSEHATTLRVKEKMKQKLERAAIEISYKTGKPIKWTELANLLFEEYTEEIKKDLIHKTK